MADNWTQLPKDLLDSITKLLSLDDLYRFSFVCQSWNSFSSSLLLPPSPKNVYLIVPHLKNPTQEDSTCHKTIGLFNLQNTKIYKIDTPQLVNRRICGSCPGGLLVTVHENGEIQVYNPFSKRVIHLPPVTKLPGVFKIVKKKKKMVYTVSMSVAGIVSSKNMQGDWVRESYIYKVIMSNSDVNNNNNIVMAIQGYPKKLAYCRLGMGKEWNLVNGNDNVRLADVTFFNGKFYTVRNSGHVFVVESMDTSFPFIKPVIDPPYRLASDKYYLVESLGELFLVMRKRYEPEVDDADYDYGDDDDVEDDYDLKSHMTTSFKVSKLDFDGPKWVNVYDLGNDRALFVGYNQSFSVSTLDFPGCKGNCIYFTDDYSDHCKDEPYGGHDIGVYSLANDFVEKCYPSDAGAIKPPPVWFNLHSC